MTDQTQPIEALAAEMKAAVRSLEALRNDLWKGRRFVEVVAAGRGIRLGDSLASQIDTILASHAAQAEEIERLRPKAAMHDRAVANGWQEMNDKAQVSTLSARLVESEAREGVLRDLVERAREELRLIRAKDSDAVYDTTLRTDFALALTLQGRG